MDEELKILAKKLGHAIDQAINESAQVKEMTEKLRQAGYETILVVEATICFARRSATLGGAKLEPSNELSEMMSEDDMQFLKRLKITVDEDAEP